MPLRRRSLAAAWVLALLAAWVSSPAGSLAARPGADTAPAASKPPSPPRGLVVVLRPPELTETMRVVLARITGELAAASFEVRTDALDPQRDPTQQIQTVALEADAVAAFALGGSRDSLSIWIFERLGHRTTIQRVPVRPGGFAQDAKVSALKAVELIRASLSDLWPAPAPRPAVAAPPAQPPPTSAASPPPSPPTQPAGPPTPPSPPTAPATPVAPAVPSPLPPPAAAAPESPTSPPPFPPPRKEEPPAAPVIESPSPPPTPPGPSDSGWPGTPGLAVGLGVAGLWDLRSTPQWMGSLHVEGRLNTRLALQARVAGLGPSLTIQAADVSASIERERGSLGAGWSFWRGARAYVALVAALGVERVTASGHATDSRLPIHSATVWMPIGLVGMSATARLATHWSVVARVEAEWAWSRVELIIDEWRTVPLARPGGLSELSIQASF